MFDNELSFRNSYEPKILTSLTPGPKLSTVPFANVFGEKSSRDYMERLYKVPGHSYLKSWGNDKVIGKSNPIKFIKKQEYALMTNDIEGTKPKILQKYSGDLTKSLDTNKLALPDIRPAYFPRKNALNETSGDTPSPEMSRKMGLLEQLQNPKPKYFSIKRRYGAPIKYGSPIRIITDPKITPKIGKNWD